MPTNDPYYKEEIARIIKRLEPFVNKLANKTVLITGATGLIGKTCVFSLLQLAESRSIDIKVIALVRNAQKAETVFEEFLTHPKLEIAESDLSSPIDTKLSPNFIIHAASPTDSKSFVSKPVDIINDIYCGTKNILELARLSKVDGLCFLSTLEVYGTSDKALLREDDFGNLDSMNPRSSYPLGKRHAECLCAGYASQYNVPIFVARLGQTFGPGVIAEDERVFAQFARRIINGQDIILHTPGNTVRSYCSLDDAVVALFYLLFRGEAGLAYNVANPHIKISIREMAQLFVDNFGDERCSVIINKLDPKELADRGYALTSYSLLDTSRLESLGFEAKTGVIEMASGLIHSLQARS